MATSLANVLTDAILVGTPIWMVYRSSSLRKYQKVQLFALFSTTIIMTFVSLGHSFFVFKSGGVRQGLTAVIEVRPISQSLGSVAHARDMKCAMSLLVANLSVVSSVIIRYKAHVAARRLRRRLEAVEKLKRAHQAPPRAPPPQNPTPVHFTSVELTLDVDLDDLDTRASYEEDERAFSPVFGKQTLGTLGISSTFLTSNGRLGALLNRANGRRGVETLGRGGETWKGSGCGDGDVELSERGEGSRGEDREGKSVVSFAHTGAEGNRAGRDMKRTASFDS